MYYYATLIKNYYQMAKWHYELYRLRAKDIKRDFEFKELAFRKRELKMLHERNKK